MARMKRIFVGFAVEDKHFRDLLRGQSRLGDSPIEYSERSGWRYSGMCMIALGSGWCWSAWPNAGTGEAPGALPATVLAGGIRASVPATVN